jgi:serine O-acetyltransferase
VVFCYPGLQAIVLYRLAHWLLGMGLPFFPRLISQIARIITGIEIHPGATIGRRAFIDHGMGVVIGETTIVGDDVLIYQGVTLGGTGKETGKRHPTLGHNVVVGAGAKVLGNIEIGSNVRIGAGSVVVKDVPPDCTVVGVPGRIVHRQGAPTAPLEHNRVPDPEGEVIKSLLKRVEQLEHQLSQHTLPTRYVIPSRFLDLVRPKQFNHQKAEAMSPCEQELLDMLRDSDSSDHCEDFSSGAGI